MNKVHTVYVFNKDNTVDMMVCPSYEIAVEYVDKNCEGLYTEIIQHDPNKEFEESMASIDRDFENIEAAKRVSNYKVRILDEKHFILMNDLEYRGAAMIAAISHGVVSVTRVDDEQPVVLRDNICDIMKSDDKLQEIDEFINKKGEFYEER